MPRRRAGLAVNPARIDGGGPNNVVPDLAILRVNLRPRTPRSRPRKSQPLIAKARRRDVAASTTSRSRRTAASGGRPSRSREEAEALFELVKQAGADLGQQIGWQPSGGVCDGNNIAACGVPVVDTMGVRGGKIHSPEEYLIVDSLAERAALSALTILRLAEARMSFRVRPATGEDFRAIYEMAKLTGGGFTNLPADRATLVAKLARSEQSLRARARTARRPTSTCSCSKIPKTEKIRGTCQVFGQVGVVQPFYSYHLSTLTQTSPELGKTFRNQMLTLTTDLEGSSEVGGLFLHPQMRAGGWGALLARSRYLFMKLHRARFGERTLAELRGVMDEAGNCALLGRARGTLLRHDLPRGRRVQCRPRHPFIADLMPQDADLRRRCWPRARKAVMGQPHPSGRAALRMLEAGGLHLRPLRRHFRRRPDRDRAHRPDPDRSRVAHAKRSPRSATAAGRRCCSQPGA